MPNGTGAGEYELVPIGKSEAPETLATLGNYNTQITRPNSGELRIKRLEQENPINSWVEMAISSSSRANLYVEVANKELEKEAIIKLEQSLLEDSRITITSWAGKKLSFPINASTAMLVKISREGEIIAYPPIFSIALNYWDRLEILGAALKKGIPTIAIITILLALAGLGGGELYAKFNTCASQIAMEMPKSQNCTSALVSEGMGQCSGIAFSNGCGATEITSIWQNATEISKAELARVQGEDLGYGTLGGAALGAAMGFALSWYEYVTELYQDKVRQKIEAATIRTRSDLSWLL